MSVSDMATWNIKLMSPLTSRISRTSHAVSKASSFSWAVPRTRSVLNRPLCV